LNVLIVYGTTEGQTRKIAEGTALRVRERGHGTEPLDSAALVLDFNIDKYDAFIIAASVHQEYHQETITNFVMAHLKLLENKPSAFISVSLSAVLEGTEAQKYLDRFVAMTGWRPRMTLLLGAAIGTTVGATAIGLGLVLALALTTTAAPTAIGCTATIIVAG